MIIEMDVVSVDRRDTTYFNITVKIGEEEMEVEGDDRSGWDDENVEEINDCLISHGIDLTFADLLKLQEEKGDKFEV